MLKRWRWTVAGTCVLLLATPREGSAGIGEWIWEMSGPMMVGGVVECRYSVLDGGWDSCTVSGVPLRQRKYDQKLWLALAGGIYGSTGKNSDGTDYRGGKVWMLAFDPMIEIQSAGNDRFGIYHGVFGVSYNLMFGPDFSSFTNAAFKLRPIGFFVPFIKNTKLDVAYNLRLYPNGFSADAFGLTSEVPSGPGTETVHSISIGLRLPLPGNKPAAP
jgi:hypothetical protein